MQNMEIILYPKQIHIATQSLMSLRLTYKKMSITTNHELQKYQNRQSYPIRNSIATINDQVKFKISKQFEFNNTKIVIVVIGTKGREVSCLGDVSLDLASLKQKKNKDKQLLKAKIQKCKDTKAFLLFDIKFIQKPIDISQMKKSRKQKIPELGILKTQYYYKEELYISRREKQDKPTAYEISRKNYKNNEILRNNINTKTVSKQKRDSKDSAKQNSNAGSYKKRFMYDVQRLDKSRQKSTTKQIGSNYLKVYQKDKSPSPRTKTPQPITLQTLKSRQTHNRTQSKVSPLNLSNVDSRKNKQLDDSNQLIDPDTFRAHNGGNNNYVKKNQQKIYNQQLNNNNTQSHQQDLSRSNVSANSLSSITNEKDNKYRMITEKLQMIQSKIRKNKQKYAESNDYDDENKSKNGNSRGNKSEIEQLQSYQIGNGTKSKYDSRNTQKQYQQSKQSQGSPYQHTEVIPSKISQSPISPSQSTCPRNQRAPSPIPIAQTPVVNKQHIDDIKMSQFTINSKKNQVYELEQQRSPQSETSFHEGVKQPRLTNKTSFDQIIEPSIKQPSNNPNQQVSIAHQTQNVSPRGQSKQRKQVSPPGLSFQKRQSQLKLQKKSSMGRNYIQTQVKMLQLQIQDKDMKYERLQKKYNKQIEQYMKKITAVSNQLIQAKTRIIELEKRHDQLQALQTQLKQKEKGFVSKEDEIKNLNLEIQRLRQLQIQLSQKTYKSKSDQNIQTQNTIEQSINSDILIAKDQQIAGLNQQLQTYLNEISSLRQRTQQLKKFKTIYQQLQATNQTNLKSIAQLQQKLKQYQMDKSIPNNNNNNFNSVSQSPKTQSKKSLSAQQTKSAQQLLQQTIQKQSLLQQSLKSLQNQNRTLTQNLKQVQNQKKSLQQSIQVIQREKAQLKQKIKQWQKQNKQLSQNIKSLQSDTKQLLQKLQKKQKTIQKLSSVNQNLNTKLFNLQQQQQKKFHDLNQQNDTLIMKSAQNQQLINQLNQKITVKDKEMKILKQLLRDREDEENRLKEEKKQQMKRQVSRVSNNSFKHGPQRLSENHPNSKSDQLLKIKVTQQGKQNYYDYYLNEKTKCTNLQAQLRYAQNQNRTYKMKIDLLIQEKKNLQQEIDMIAYNNQKDLAKRGLQHKVSMESQSIAESVKLQNKVLKEQIKVLQSQVRDLNSLLDSAIQKTANFQASQVASILSNQPSTDKSLINQKYLALVKRLQAYESELRVKKNKMAQIVNAIWRGGNASLIDQIDRIMGVQE